MIVFILVVSGCSPYLIGVIDSNDQPVNHLTIDLLNLEEDKIGNAEPKGDGKYKINKSDVSSDSFYIFINSEGYFPFQRMLPISAPPGIDFRLEKRITAIVGYVVEDSKEMPTLDNCTVRTLPETVETTTDNRGKFVIKSERFAETEYTIFVHKAQYDVGNATFTPTQDQVDTLFQAIFLKPIVTDTIPHDTTGKGIYIPPYDDGVNN